jgi:hypothetical protein
MYLVPSVALRVVEQVDVLVLLPLLALRHPGVVGTPPALEVRQHSTHLRLNARVHQAVRLGSTCVEEGRQQQATTQLNNL